MYTFFFKGKQQPECIFCDCLLTLYDIFLECSDTFPAPNLLLFTKVHINYILQFCRSVSFKRKLLKDIFMSVGWDGKWCPVSRITTLQVNKKAPYQENSVRYCPYNCYFLSFIHEMVRQVV